jgi:hypothetical protein
MLYVTPLSTDDCRALQRLLRRGSPRIALHANCILASATGLAVPEIARLFGCCRRTVRLWIHRFQTAGMRCLLPSERRAVAEPADNSAMSPLPAEPSGRLVPAIPLTVPEIRRLLNSLAPTLPVAVEYLLHWSNYRRYKQALAMISHHRKRGYEPPTLGQVRL